MQRTKNTLSEQIHEHIDKKSVSKKVDTSKMISTGSTLLDLAISGGVKQGGGIPGGILAEIFGPPSCGKTLILCEIARHVQQQNGAVKFFDPEARLNQAFATMLGLDVNKIEYERPDTVTKVFVPIRKWDVDTHVINGIFADSLAALSTEIEMESEDKMGMRRAKEFSEQLRRTCRILANKNYLMVCSNQVRQNLDAGPYGQKWSTPGGQAFPFYSSLRLQCRILEKVKRKRTIANKEQVRIIGVTTEVQVVKNSVWESYRSVPVTILFSYGIDDLRENLQYVKQNTGRNVYTINNEKLSNSLDEAINEVESDRREKELAKEVIDLWEEIEKKFTIKRDKQAKM